MRAASWGHAMALAAPIHDFDLDHPSRLVVDVPFRHMVTGSLAEVDRVPVINRIWWQQCLH